VKVELLYFEGCPGYETVLERVRRLLHDAGGDTDIELRRVETPEAATAARFLGSPTVRVDGRDIERGAEDRTDFGLKCRLYRGPGGASPVPPEQWLIDALGADGDQAA
jgi:hypothetical protein